MRNTVFGFWVLVLGALQWARVWAVWQSGSVWAEFSLSVPPLYVLSSAAVWGGVLWLAALGVWQLKGWGRHLAFAGVAASLLNNWLDRFMFMRSDYVQLSHSYVFFSTLLMLLLTWGLWWQKSDQPLQESL